MLARGLALFFGGTLLAVIGFGVWNRQNIAKVARNWNELSAGSAIARELHSPQDMLRYIEQHPAEVSWVAYDADDEAHGLFLNADRPRVLAGAAHLLVLCAYAAALERGELQPNERVAVADWDKYLLPKTDGAAHELALSQLRSGKYIDDDAVQLQDLVFAMMRLSDQAAADYVMQRVGRARLEALPALLGLPSIEPPLPFSGMLLSWEGAIVARAPGAPGAPDAGASAAERIAQLRGMDRQTYADEVWRLSAALRDDAPRRAAERARLTRQDGLALTLREQAEFASALSPHASAHDFARLMAKIEQAELPGSAAIKAELQWPMQQPELSARFVSLGTKSGSWPSIIASVTFARAHGKQAARVSALFMEDMPMAVWLELMQGFWHQRVEQAALGDDAFFGDARERLRRAGAAKSPAAP